MIEFTDNNIEWGPNIKSMFKKFFKSPETQKYIKEQDFTALFDKAIPLKQAPARQGFLVKRRAFARPPKRD